MYCLFCSPFNQNTCRFSSVYSVSYVNCEFYLRCIAGCYISLGLFCLYISSVKTLCKVSDILHFFTLCKKMIVDNLWMISKWWSSHLRLWKGIGHGSIKTEPYPKFSSSISGVSHRLPILESSSSHNYCVVRACWSVVIVILESQKQLCRELERSLEEALILVIYFTLTLYIGLI